MEKFLMYVYKTMLYLLGEQQYFGFFRLIYYLKPNFYGFIVWKNMVG